MFLSFHGFHPHNGISKKKLAQIKGLRECGNIVINCYYTVNPGNGDRYWMVDDSVLLNLGVGILAKFKKRINYKPIFNCIIEQQIELVYIRSEHNANPFLIHFVRVLKKAGVRIVMEIPTYPYDNEYTTLKGKFKLSIDRIFRKKLAQELNAIVTFSEENEIFGQRTIRISNGIDFSTIRMKRDSKKPGELHLIGVAEIHFWHGFDRLLTGLRDYYSRGHTSCNVFFHIVGEFTGDRERGEILPLVGDAILCNYVTLHGSLYGADLDGLFDLADLGIGSLARHRSGISAIKTLKNREYAARGIPFIYSETDSDFDAMQYVLKVPADESSIDINQLVGFLEQLRLSPVDIRQSVVHLSWKEQMNLVVHAL